MREVEKQRLNAVSFEEAQDKLEYTQVAGELAADTLRVAHKDQNQGQGATKAKYGEATMAFMGKQNTFVKMYTKWLGQSCKHSPRRRVETSVPSKITCMPTGAARKYLTTITDVFLLVSLDEARDGTQKNTQGVWPCKLPIDNLPLQ